jgi:hypothetical protein
MPDDTYATIATTGNIIGGTVNAQILSDGTNYLPILYTTTQVRVAFASSVNAGVFCVSIFR